MDKRDEILAKALTMAPGKERTAYVEGATADHPERCREILELLRVHDQAGDFLEISAWEQDRTLESANQPRDPSIGQEQILQRLPRPAAATGLAELGPFLLLELLGEGGSACVFQARDRRLDRIVAIKILKPWLAANPEQRQRFLDESRMIAGLRSEQIVSIFEVGEYESLPYFVMEYLPLGSLQAWLSQQGPLTFDDTLTIARQVLAALRLAHSQGLLHRDLKPSNLLVDRFPDRVKLSDFGLARAVLTEASDRAVGTPQFSAPEQIRGEPVDERTDLFGFGCLLYALLVGHSPFAGTSRLQTIQMTLELEPEPLSHFGVQVPAEFQQLLNRLLAKSPQDRPSDLPQVEQQLEFSAAAARKLLPDRRRWLWAAGGLAAASGVGYLLSQGLGRTAANQVLPIGGAVFQNISDDRLMRFLHASEHVTLVTAEPLSIPRPICYWRPGAVNKPGKVTYRFEFPQPLRNCRLKCITYLATGFDQLAYTVVRVGPSESELYPAVSLNYERLEYWPAPGVGPSYPLIRTIDMRAFEGPHRWIDLSELLRGKQTLYFQAELFGSKEVLTSAGVSLGPAAAQFLRTMPASQQVCLAIEPSA